MSLDEKSRSLKANTPLSKLERMFLKNEFSLINTADKPNRVS